MFSVGTQVTYKNISGPVVHSSDSSISILMKEESDPFEQVRIFVPDYEFENVHIISRSDSQQ
jgi:hypothetical protein